MMEILKRYLTFLVDAHSENTNASSTRLQATLIVICGLYAGIIQNNIEMCFGLLGIGFIHKQVGRKLEQKDNNEKS
jgi:hypothetical protein